MELRARVCRFVVPLSAFTVLAIFLVPSRDRMAISDYPSSRPDYPSVNVSSAKKSLDGRFVDREKIFQDRSERLRLACQMYTNDSAVQFPWADNHHTILWNYQHRIAYCPIPKSGSSTFVSLLFSLSPWLSHSSLHATWRSQYHAHAQKLFHFPLPVWPRTGDGARLFSLLFSFAFVRHPFVRLVSAYQDKIVDHSLFDFFDRDGLGDGPTARRKHIRRLKKEPSFRQFVNIFLEVYGARKRGSFQHVYANPHVQPYWAKCGFCYLNYSAIGKAETSDEDVRYILLQAGIEGDGPKPIHASSGGSTTQLARAYFSTLDRGQVEELYEYYKFDFEAFGYSHEEYLALARV